LNSLPGNPSTAFNYLSTFGNVANAHYNSLQFRFQRDQKQAPIIGNAGYLFSYTFSKSIDNASGFRSRDGSVPFYNHGLFKAVSDFDIPQYLSLSGVWELPFQNMWRSGPTRLLSGWNLWPIITYESGNPLDVTSGLSRNITNPGPSGAGDQNLVRANILSPLANFDPHVNQTFRNRPADYWFDPTIFASVPSAASVGNYGSFPRNALRAPSWGNVNLTISKVVPVRESVRMEYRADFFNLLNHAEFLAPNTSITNSAFGQISTTQPPRIIQMALRLQF